MMVSYLPAGNVLTLLFCASDQIENITVTKSKKAFIAIGFSL
jgi:hypothetical protein